MSVADLLEILNNLGEDALPLQIEIGGETIETVSVTIDKDGKMTQLWFSLTG